MNGLHYYQKYYDGTMFHIGFLLTTVPCFIWGGVLLTAVPCFIREGASCLLRYHVSYGVVCHADPRERASPPDP